jgi:hypothetical protein
VPTFNAFDHGTRNSHLDRRNHRQWDVMINGFVMIESDLGALAPGFLLGWGLFRFAMTVRQTTAFCARPHKVFVA